MEVKINKIQEQINVATGKLIAAKPRLLQTHTAGVIEFEVCGQTGICLENYSQYKSLGRVAFRERGQTVMAGMVQQLL